MKLAPLILALLTPLALAQPAPQPAPLPTCASPTLATFDVASVKPSQLEAGSWHNSGTADSVTGGGTIFHMIQTAYGLRDYQISGGPNWLTNSTWDIVAKVDQPPANYNSLTRDARTSLQRQRMAAVLAQRFNLKCHFETKQLPIYNLVLAKGGAKLPPTPADSSKKGNMNWNGQGRQNNMDATGVELTAVANMLSQVLGRTVVDKTGLTGLYDAKLNWTSDPPANAPASTDAAASGPSIFTALEEQLGLKLESAKGPVPVLVIDSIDKPSEN
ncbi:MAG TPA: TIGR03435 family protein [Acidobacteriaceae bacterium]|nr:TIGR03435 family protein [Acidobacteriaceae bacterium]